MHHAGRAEEGLENDRRLVSKDNHHRSKSLARAPVCIPLYLNVRISLEPFQALSGRPMQVLESIPTPLVLLILRAIFIPARTCSANEKHLVRRPTVSAAEQLAQMLPSLPPRLQPLAIQAHDPAIDRSTLTLTDTSAATAATIVAAAASSSLRITAVFLRNIACMPPNASPSHAHTCPHAALHDVLKDLARFSTLRSLTLSGVAVAPHDRELTMWSAVYHLSGLTHLEASKRVGLGVGRAGFVGCLPGLTSLRSLNLSSCGLSGGKAAATQHSAELEALAGGLQHLSCLQLLSLAQNPLTNAGLWLLAPVLASLPLRSLVLRGCGLELGEGLQLGGGGVNSSMHSCLSRLDISDNSLRKPGHALGCRLLQLRQLKHLHLRGLEADTAAQLCLFGQLKARNLGLVKLHLGRISKSQPVLQALRVCLGQCLGLEDVMVSFTQPVPLISVVPWQQLKCLVLSRVSLCDVTAALLMEQAAMPQLTELALTGIEGSQKGVSSFGVWLVGCTAIQLLSLETSREGSPGGNAIAQALRQLPQLRRLRLHGLRHVCAPTGSLAQSLRELPRLQHLLLGGSRMVPQDWMAVMAAAGSLPDLEVLSVQEDEVGRGAVRELKGCLPGMTRLQELVMLKCGVSNVQKQEIVNSLHPAVKHTIK